MLSRALVQRCKKLAPLKFDNWERWPSLPNPALRPHNESGRADGVFDDKISKPNQPRISVVYRTALKLVLSQYRPNYDESPMACSATEAGIYFKIILFHIILQDHCKSLC